MADEALQYLCFPNRVMCYVPADVNGAEVLDLSGEMPMSPENGTLIESDTELLGDGSDVTPSGDVQASNKKTMLVVEPDSTGQSHACISWTHSRRGCTPYTQRVTIHTSEYFLIVVSLQQHAYTRGVFS